MHILTLLLTATPDDDFFAFCDITNSKHSSTTQLAYADFDFGSNPGFFVDNAHVAISLNVT